MTSPFNQPVNRPRRAQKPWSTAVIWLWLAGLLPIIGQLGQPVLGQPVLAQPAAAAQYQTTIRMACSTPANSPLTTYVSQLYNEALNPFGIKIDVVPMSLSQELKEIQEGKVGASCLRVQNLREFTDMRGFHIVETPSYNGKYYVVNREGASRSRDIKRQRTAILKGHLYVERMLVSQGAQELIKVSNDTEAINLLKRGKVDQAILWEVGLHQHRELLKKNQLTISHLFLSLPLHAVFVEQHAEVAQLLNRRLASVQPKLSDQIFQFSRSSTQTYQETLIMACHIPSKSELAKWIMQVYRKTFDKLNYNLEIRLMTRERATQELNAGRVDLDCARTRVFAERSSDAVMMIPAQVGVAEVNIYTRNPGPQIRGYQHFSPEDRLTHVRGSRRIEAAIKRYGLNSYAALDAEASLKMLITGRADYYLGFVEETELSVNRALLKDQIYNRGAIEKSPVYMFIHARHKKLIPEITRAFEDLNTFAPWK